MKINSIRLGLAIGIVWAVGIFIFTLISAWTDFGYQTLTNFALYPWYTVSFWGAFIGAIFGFIDGFIGGWAIGWMYNKLGGK